MNKKLKKRLHNWLRNHNEIKPHFCACGCGKQIIATEAHYRNNYKIPKFIAGHNLKVVDKATRKQSSKNLWDTLSESEKNERINRLKKFESGEQNPNWKGGWFKDSNGYIRVLAPEHVFNINGYCLEHRLVVEEWLRKNDQNSSHLVTIGKEKYLDPEKVVHHINEVKDDNRIENLFIFTPQEHCFWHNSLLPPAEKLKVI